MRKNKRKRPDDGPDWPDWVKVVHAMFCEGPACEKPICVAVRAVRQAERLVRVVTPQGVGADRPRPPAVRRGPERPLARLLSGAQRPALPVS